jgi:hypothetical protein
MTQEGVSPIFGEHRIIIRVDDQGGGPYLVVRGYNSEPVKGSGETGHEFFLNSEAEIDEFAATCKALLKQAERTQEQERKT